MINITIRLTGEYPSDFKPDMIVEGIQQYFESLSLNVARMLSGNKCGFHEKYPEDMDYTNFNKHYRLAFTYRALNRLIQGSAADMTKQAMVNLYNKGILPHIQIHDELCVSIPNKEVASKDKEVMENAIRLRIPNKVDYASGKNWGNIK